MIFTVPLPTTSSIQANSNININNAYSITVDNMNALVNRVEVRTANMVSVEPVCADIKKKLIDCYDNATNDDVIKCWDTIGKCYNYFLF